VEISFSNNVAEVNELNYISQIQVRILDVLKLCLFYEMRDNINQVGSAVSDITFLPELSEIKEKMVIHGRYVEEGLIELYKSAKDYTKGFPILEDKNVKGVYMIMNSTLLPSTIYLSFSVRKIWIKDMNIISVLKNSMNFAHDVENDYFYSEFEEDPIPTSSYYFFQSMIPVLFHYYFFYSFIIYLLFQLINDKVCGIEALKKVSSIFLQSAQVESNTMVVIIAILGFSLFDFS
jgi:hypothetical protein